MTKYPELQNASFDLENLFQFKRWPKLGSLERLKNYDEEWRQVVKNPWWDLEVEIEYIILINTQAIKFLKENLPSCFIKEVQVDQTHRTLSKPVQRKLKFRNLTQFIGIVCGQAWPLACYYTKSDSSAAIKKPAQRVIDFLKPLKIKSILTDLSSAERAAFSDFAEYLFLCAKHAQSSIQDKFKG